MPLPFVVFRPSRRQFVQESAALLAAGTFPIRVRAALPPRAALRGQGPHLPELPATAAERVDPALVKQLALRAVEAATAAGATYADVRLSRTVTQNVTNVNGMAVGYDEETLGVGVRCLVKGYWGFAASAVWHPEEIVALAQTAAAQAKANATGPQRPVEWTPVPAAQGDWATPLAIDPFTIPLEERFDYGNTEFGARAMADARPPAVLEAVRRGEPTAPLTDPVALNDPALGLGGLPTYVEGSPAGWRQELALATSEGAYCTQTLFRDPWGWEANRDKAKHFLQRIPDMWTERRRLAALAMKPVELGRYDVVLAGGASAGLVAMLGEATQLDRALGYEANAGGTSYLGPDPLALLGTFQVGSEHLTLTANRSMPHGLATVKWDAEGVEPEDVTLIKEGVLVDYQTTREQAGWLAPYYQKIGKPVRGHGYAGVETALHLPIQCTPNLVLEPGQPGTPAAEMIKSIKKGIYIIGVGGTGTDFQMRTGSLTTGGENALAREIVNGKLGARLSPFTMLFRTQELWKNLVAIGPATEAGLGAGGGSKGQPIQSYGYSVQAVPLQFKNQTIIHAQ